MSPLSEWAERMQIEPKPLSPGELRDIAGTAQLNAVLGVDGDQCGRQLLALLQHIAHLEAMELSR
jgi:hypothetical protein